MRAALSAAAVAATVVLAGCGNTVSSLSYTPPAAVQQAASPAIARVDTVDRRKEAPARLATIMGGFGNPLKTLDTAKPVKDEVGDAFQAGLRARNLMRPGAGPLSLTVEIRKFDADMIMGRTARIDLTASLVDASGRTVYAQPVVDSTSDFKFLETGVFADIADLQRMCQLVLDRTVDRVLDDPRFRAALRPGSV